MRLLPVQLSSQPFVVLVMNLLHVRSRAGRTRQNDDDTDQGAAAKQGAQRFDQVHAGNQAYARAGRKEGHTGSNNGRHRLGDRRRNGFFWRLMRSELFTGIWTLSGWRSRCRHPAEWCRYTMPAMNGSSVCVRYGMPMLTKIANSIQSTSRIGSDTDLKVRAIIMKIARMETRLTILKSMSVTLIRSQRHVALAGDQRVRIVFLCNGIPDLQSDCSAHR